MYICCVVSFFLFFNVLIFYTVIYYQVFLSYFDNLQIVLSDPETEPKQVLLLRFKIDQGVKAMKWYSTLPTSLELEPHH